MSELKYWLGFNYVNGIGPAKVQALLGRFPTLADAWAADDTQLREIGFDARAIQSLNETRRTLDLDRYVAEVQATGAQLLTWESADYPALLREIPTPPPLLFVRGQFEVVDRWAVAVVGTRRLSAYGRQAAHELANGLARAGVTIVSGLARGIDAIAHRAALEAGGRTIAVMACGIDKVYPPEHRQLAHDIADGHGAVITEYPFGAEPESGHFPARNRLISGLALGVLVVEAGERSGALITARNAIEQSRDVFAVPGSIYSPSSVGPNQLIQSGAKLVRHVDDILEELNLQMVTDQAVARVALPDTAEEAALLAQLSSEPRHVDDLGRLTGLPSSLISSTLTLMELKGMVQQVGGMQYVRLRESGPVYDQDDGN
jgi:DNA processing protein